MKMKMKKPRIAAESCSQRHNWHHLHPQKPQAKPTSLTKKEVTPKKKTVKVAKTTPKKTVKVAAGNKGCKQKPDSIKTKHGRLSVVDSKNGKKAYILCTAGKLREQWVQITDVEAMSHKSTPLRMICKMFEELTSGQDACKKNAVKMKQDFYGCSK